MGQGAIGNGGYKMLGSYYLFSIRLQKASEIQHYQSLTVSGEEETVREFFYLFLQRTQILAEEEFGTYCAVHTVF